ncbi:hypothetical protein [Halorubrum sp. DTA98]|uniref:hypothetical protein n=1 Tax=Halorubrum sp. DTA98 TaxID=3402163 RepID=UPI003AAD6A32
MTQDDTRSDGATSADRASDGDGGTDDAGAAVDVDSDATGDAADVPEDVEFGDLTLPQRVFVAAVQNPTRGVVIVALFAFAFSFYVAFWMVFPRVAAFLSGTAVVLALMALGIYYLVKRLF